jgi:hypothetical protein
MTPARRRQVADVTIEYDLPVLMRNHAVLSVEFLPECMRHPNRAGPGDSGTPRANKQW